MSIIATRTLAGIVALTGTACALAGEPPVFGPLSEGVALSPHPRFIGSGVELADVNGDGLNDIVLSDNYGQFSYTHVFSVFLNGGDGTFAPAVTSSVATEGNEFYDLALTLGDLNGDGRADLVTTRLSMFTPPNGNRPNIAVLFGQADGRFTGQQNIANSSTDQFMRRISERGAALGDMNGDGTLDIVSPASSFTYSVLPGNGDGTFAAPIQSGAGYGELTLLGDLDADGDLDVVGVYNIGSDNRVKVAVVVQMNDGTGVLTAAPSFTLDMRLNALRTGQARGYLTDLDGDAMADLVLLGERGSQSGAGGIYVLKSTGEGTFSELFRETRGQDGERTGTILVADFNGDDAPDILKVPNAGFDGEMLVNDGTGHFPTRSEFFADISYLVAGAAGDIGGSGLPDVVLYDDTINTEAPTRVRWSINLTPEACLADYNGDGFVDGIDYDAFNNDFEAGNASADVNGDGFVDGIDYDSFNNAFAAGC